MGSRDPRARRPLTSQALERAAMSYVQRFPTSVNNLRRVLDRKIGRADVDDVRRAELAAAREQVIGQLLAAGLLDDKAYARALAQSLKRKGQPRFRIARTLRDKGIEEPEREEALAAISEEEDPDLVAAWNLARRRRLGPFRLDDEQRQARREKDLGVLARAGFPFGLARKVVDGDLDEAPEHLAW